MKAPKISIIVPVYNVEDYLVQCIESIINQDYENLEIFLVDDGSTDRSSIICEEYKQLDKRIIVIHKENGGLSSARNIALDNITGSYVTFVDSDDYVESTYVSSLYKILNDNNAQISVCGEKRFYYNEKKSKCFIPSPYKKIKGEKILSPVEGLSTYMLQDLFDASAWGKLYSSNLFTYVRYPEGKNYEDIGTTFKLFCNSTKISCISSPLYCYLQRENSILHNKTNTKTLWDGIEMVELQEKEVVKVFPELLYPAICRCFSMYCHVLKDSISSDDMELKEYAWKKIREERIFILKTKKCRKKAKIAALISFLGKKVFMTLLERK